MSLPIRTGSGRPATRLGATLLEAMLVVLLLGILFTGAAPPLARALDRAAVAGARNALAAALVRTRLVAVARGGAALRIVPDSARVAIVQGADLRPVAEVDLGAAWGVALEVDGQSSGPVLIVYDGYGIGRMANRVLRVRRGAAEARITVSAYGRPRPW